MTLNIKVNLLQNDVELRKSTSEEKLSHPVSVSDTSAEEFLLNTLQD